MLSIPFPSLSCIITHEFLPFTTIQSNPYTALPFHISFILCHSIPFAKPQPNIYLSQMPIMLFSPLLILLTYSIIHPSPIYSDPFHLHQLIQLCPFTCHPVPYLIPSLIPPSFYPTIWPCPFPYVPYLLYFPTHSFLSNTWRHTPSPSAHFPDLPHSIPSVSLLSQAIMSLPYYSSIHFLLIIPTSTLLNVTSSPPLH